MASKLIVFPFFLDMGSSLVSAGKLEVMGSKVQGYNVSVFQTNHELEPRGKQARKLWTCLDTTLNGET